MGSIQPNELAVYRGKWWRKILGWLTRGGDGRRSDTTLCRSRIRWQWQWGIIIIIINCHNNNNNNGNYNNINNNGIVIIIIIEELIRRWILINTAQSALTRSHSRTLAKYTNNNMPTAHARTWTDENKTGEKTNLRMWEKMCFKARFERAQSECLTERQREFVPGRRTKDGQRARANSRKFGLWDFDTESICRRADGAWRWVKVDSVAEIPRSGLMNALVAEGVYFTLNPVKLAASAGSREDQKYYLFSSFQVLDERQSFQWVGDGELRLNNVDWETCSKWMGLGLRVSACGEGEVPSCDI